MCWAGRSSKLKQNSELGWRFVDNEEQGRTRRETSSEYYQCSHLAAAQGFLHQPGRIGDWNLRSRNQVLRQREEERDRAENHRHRCHHHRRADQLRLRHHGHHRCLGRFEAEAISDQATGKVQHDTINDLNTVMSTLNTVQDSLTDLQDTLAQSDTILADAKQTTASLRQTAAAQKASRQSGTLLAETQAGSQAFSTTLVGALN